MKRYPVMISSGVFVPLIIKRTHTLGRRAIMVAGTDEVCGYTIQVAKNVYTPVVCVGDEEIYLPRTHRQLEAMGDVIRYLDDIKDPKLDLPWWELATRGHVSELPLEPQEEKTVGQ